MKNASRLLRDLLKSGMSQADISRQLQVHHSQVSRWLSGKPPKQLEAGALLVALHAQIWRPKK